MCVDIFFLKSFLMKLLYHMCVVLEGEREREMKKYYVNSSENISYNVECAYENNHVWKK
jgi:hypothetical protein